MKSSEVRWHHKSLAGTAIHSPTLYGVMLWIVRDVVGAMLNGYAGMPEVDFLPHRLCCIIICRGKYAKILLDTFGFLKFPLIWTPNTVTLKRLASCLIRDLHRTLSYSKCSMHAPGSIDLDVDRSCKRASWLKPV